MNKILTLLSCFIFVLPLAGCGRQNEKISNQPQLESEIPEELLYEAWDGESTGGVFPDFFGDQRQRTAFPDFLVGVWEVKTGRYKDKWGFKFEPDGSILRIIYAAEGPVYLAEGESYGEATSEDGEDAYYFVTMGSCEARYTPETRMLKVQIVMEHMLKLSPGELEGRVEDYLEGTVSEDGRIWKADWLKYGWFKDTVPPAPDPNVIKAHSVPLVFTKRPLVFAKSDRTQVLEEDDVQ